MLKIIAKNVVKDEFKEKFLNIVKELVQKSNEEEGCFFYRLYQDVENKNVFTIMEEWRDETAIELHNNSEHFKRLIPQMREVAESAEINVYKEAL